ncbi:MAG: excisionase family DNA binding domain-containing protein, partial [candidate division WWE3 bacterium CSP1-7]
MSENLPNRTLPVSKAASFLGVSAETLRRWDRKGILKPFRTKGGQRRYSLTNLEAYKSGERSAKTPLKISQAAEQLGVHPETLRRWEKDGAIRAERTNGGQRRYDQRDLETMRTGESGGQAPLLPSISPQIPVRTMEQFRPRPSYRFLKLFAVVMGLLIAVLGWSQLSPLSKERLKRAFSPSVQVPIADVNDVMGYKLSESFEILGLKFKFPVDLPGLVTQTFTVLGDSVLNGARFLGTVLFGQGNDYFITPTGDTSFNSVTSNTGEVTTLRVTNLTVTGTSTGTGGGGGGGPAEGGDADTLGGQAGSYYLDLDNETGTCTDCLTGVEIDESTLTISLSDADTLDGQDGTYYLDLDNETGTCANCLSTTEIDESTFTGLNSTNIDDIYLFNNGDTGTGTYTFEDDVTLGLTAADSLIVNAAVASDIIPIDSLQDLGSAGLRWFHVFADEINATTIVGTISGGETTSADWRINSDNGTADLQDATITFDRGTESPNGVLRWNSSADQYLFEVFPLALDGQLISGVTTGTAPFSIASTTLVTNLNADLLDDQEGSYYLDLDNEVGTCADCLTGAEIDESSLAGVDADLLEGQAGSFYLDDFDDVYANSITAINFDMEIDNTNGLTFDMTTTGDFIIRDSGQNLFTFGDNSIIDIRPANLSAASGRVMIDGAVVDSTTDLGLLDINMDTVTTGASGINLDFQVLDAAGDLTVYGQRIDLLIDSDPDQSHTAYGQYIAVDLDDASSTAYGLYVDADADNLGTGTELAFGFEIGDSSTATQLEVGRLIRNTSGIAAAGLGAYTSTYLEDAAGALFEAGRVGFRAGNVTSGAASAAAFMVYTERETFSDMFPAFAAYVTSADRLLCMNGTDGAVSGWDCFGMAIGSANAVVLNFDGTSRWSFDYAGDGAGIVTMRPNNIADELKVKTLGAKAIYFDTSNNGTDLYIASGGDVGIGTDSPSYKLTVST